MIADLNDFETHSTIASQISNKEKVSVFSDWTLSPIGILIWFWSADSEYYHLQYFGTFVSCNLDSYGCKLNAKMISAKF